ncbi:MAG: SLC13 family permease, partial [Phycisphaerae bacterium]
MKTRAGLLVGPVLGLLVYALSASHPDMDGTVRGLSQSGRAVAAVGTLMAVLWVTEALPVPVTALLPIALFPLLTGGAITVRAAAAPYAHDLIYLFMGGFMLASAMQRWDLHRRIALRTVSLIGPRPPAIIAGFMIASAFLSMWVSNTATVVMMLPIAVSVVDLVRSELRRGRTDSPVGRAVGSAVRGETPAQASGLSPVREASEVSPGGLADGGESQPFNFAICLMLATAYAASIGGIATLIGTPPNLLLAAFLSTEYGIEISFVRWLGVGLPLVVLFLPITWLLLTKVIYPIRLPTIPGERSFIRDELHKLGPMSRGEWMVLIVFLLTAAAWITRPALIKLTLPGDVKPLAGLSDA